MQFLGCSTRNCGAVSRAKNAYEMTYDDSFAPITLVENSYITRISVVIIHTLMHSVHNSVLIVHSLVVIVHHRHCVCL
jgi:hypothetical protein